MLSTGSISYSINPNNNLDEFKNEINQSINALEQSKSNNKSTSSDKENVLESTDDNTRINKKKNKKIISNNISINKVINYNTNPIIDNKDKILVSYEENNGNPEFIFYNNKNSLLGSFNILQLIQYLSTPYYKNNDNNDIPFQIIKNLIFTINIEKDNHDIEIKFKSYMESPFTGNLEMLLKLSSGMKNYENNIESELLKIENDNIRKKIKLIIKQFNYCLLNHMLKIIHSISQEIKNDPTKSEIKEKLLKYSLGINFRIGTYIRNQLENQIEQNKKIGDNMISLLDVKKKILNKIDNLENTILKQNDKIDNLLNKLDSSKEKNIQEYKENKSPSINLNSSSSMTSKSVMESIEDKLKDKFNLNSLNDLLEDNDNNYESDHYSAKSIDSIESLESHKNNDKSDSMSQISGIYKINYNGQ